jgi:predicted dehydrogenase
MGVVLKRMDSAGSPLVGLAGCGRWGLNILRDLLALGARVAVADPSREARAEAVSRGAESAVAVPADLPEADGLLVAVPTLSHPAVLRELLPRWVPLFCERPLTIDPDTAWDLVRRAPRRLFVMDKWRYHPGIEAIAASCRAGEVGKPVSLSTLRVQSRIAPYDVDAVWAMAPSELAIALEVLGDIPPPIEARAESAAGGPELFRAKLGPEPSFAFEVSTRAPAWRRETRLVGSDGAVLWASDDPAAVRVVRAGRIERREVSSEEPLLREIRAFLAHLRGGPPPRSAAAEGAAAVECLARLRVMAGLDPPRG